MWLFNSSIGRKVVMSVTGLSLVLFLLFHASMNITLLFSQEAYNMICEFLGANWYALVGTLGLAFLAVVHIVYAFMLTIQNYRARGNDRYAQEARQEGVDWNSKNMLALGIIILGGLCIHLFNFWFRMQFAEIIGHATGSFDPTDGAAYVRYTFSKWYYVAIYVIWLGAIWFHLTHGIWSGMHTLGASGNTWLPRIKVISNIFATLIVLMFLSVVICYACGLEPKLKDSCPQQTECCMKDKQDCCKAEKADCCKAHDEACKQACEQCCKGNCEECCKGNCAECCKAQKPECCKEGAECCKPDAECCKAEK